MISYIKNLKTKLKNKEYRDAFIAEHIDTGLPFQIRSLRKQRNWTQKDLAKRANMHQARISQMEDPNYSKFALATLKQLASTFDIGLVVRFVPISDLVKWELNLSSDSLKVLSFDEESYFQEKEEKTNTLADEQYARTSGKVISIDKYISRIENKATEQDMVGSKAMSG